MIQCSEKNFKTQEVKSMYLLFEGVLNARIELWYSKSYPRKNADCNGRSAAEWRRVRINKKHLSLNIVLLVF